MKIIQSDFNKSRADHEIRDARNRQQNDEDLTIDALIDFGSSSFYSLLVMILIIITASGVFTLFWNSVLLSDIWLTYFEGNGNDWPLHLVSICVTALTLIIAVILRRPLSSVLSGDAIILQTFPVVTIHWCIRLTVAASIIFSLAPFVGLMNLSWEIYSLALASLFLGAFFLSSYLFPSEELERAKKFRAMLRSSKSERRRARRMARSIGKEAYKAIRLGNRSNA